MLASNFEATVRGFVCFPRDNCLPERPRSRNIRGAGHTCLPHVLWQMTNVAKEKTNCCDWEVLAPWDQLWLQGCGWLGKEQDAAWIRYKHPKCWIHWRREWQTTPVFLPWEPHELYKRYDTKRWASQVRRCLTHHWGRVEDYY